MNSENTNNIKTDIVNVTKWSIKKTKDFFKNLIFNKLNFYESLKESKITPNNIVSSRIVFLFFGVLLFSIWQRELWLLVLVISAVWDFVDWKVARINNQKSKNGELYDAWVDKITDVKLSVLSTIELISNPLLASISSVISILKTYQHYKGQFREGRPEFKEQSEIFYDSFFHDEETKFIEEKTKWAANKFGKYKTIAQFSWTLWILLNSIISEHIDMGISSDIINCICVTSWWVSIILWHLSNNTKKN